MRYVYSLRKYDHISEKVCDFLGSSFDNWVRSRVLVLLYKIIQTRLPAYIYHRLSFSRSVRSNTLLPPRHSTNVMSNSFIVRSARLWNGLPSAIKCISTLRQYKRALRELYKVDSH